LRTENNTKTLKETQKHRILRRSKYGIKNV
jgi:hypothetical protein